jgi:lipocalin
VWGMQFVWPFKGDFRIVVLNADYTHTVIGREKRDYVWIMARQPTIRPQSAGHQSCESAISAQRSFFRAARSSRRRNCWWTRRSSSP